MVPGTGPQPARGMIVGEAPDFEDEEKGWPFSGPAGRMLDTGLHAFGLDGTELYMTNVVKVVPQDDEGRIRRPTQEEIEEYRELLENEIQSTAPWAILSLGKTATHALTGLDLPAGSKVGNVYTAWHPRYVLRERRTYGIWLEQLRLWAEVLQRAAA